MYLSCSGEEGREAHARGPIKIEESKTNQFNNPPHRRDDVGSGGDAREAEEANELLVAVGKQDEARVRRLIGIGHDPDDPVAVEM